MGKGLESQGTRERNGDRSVNEQLWTGVSKLSREVEKGDQKGQVWTRGRWMVSR